MVNTRDQLLAAAAKLFSERGYARTTIGDIEDQAGLAPRAGTFYRHFPSKQSIFQELAKTQIAEREGEFDLEGVRALKNTRAELISIGQVYERASKRQAAYLRLIEEFRCTADGTIVENEVNVNMMRMLMKWVASKRAGRRLKPRRLASLTLTVFGGWLFYLSKLQQGISIPALERDELLQTWASTWAEILD